MSNDVAWPPRILGEDMCPQAPWVHPCPHYEANQVISTLVVGGLHVLSPTVLVYM